MPKQQVYEPIPLFGEHVEAVTQAEPVETETQIYYGLVFHQISVGKFFEPHEDFDIDVGRTASTLSQDYDKISAVRPAEDLSSTDLTELSTNLSAMFHSDVVKLTTITPNPVYVTDKLIEVVSYPAWASGIAVAAGEVYSYEDNNLYQVIQSHTTQSDWTPPIAKALWKRYYEPSDDPWEWVQPTGAHDAYPLGARVLYYSDVYESLIDANVWAPDVYGWKNLTAPITDAWSPGVAYSVNDEVVYEGLIYRCLQAHTSQVGWEPPAVPALWDLID